MLDIGFARGLGRIRFSYRATVDGDGVIYRLADGSGHVRMDHATWRNLNARFEKESGQVLRRAQRYLFLLPFGIFVFGMTFAQVLPWGGVMILAGFFGGPIGIYLWQSGRIERLGRELELELAGRARVAAPATPPRPTLHALELVALLVVGPHLVFAVIGSLFPDVFRNTPLTGTHVDAFAIVGFAVIAAILLLRWRQVRPMPRLPRTGPAADPVGRKVDPLARARDSAA